MIALAAFSVPQLTAAPSEAATLSAGDCSQEEVQEVVDRAADGDTVTIPAGTCTWTTRVTITGAITLQGAGVGSTIIQDGVAAGALLDWNCVPNGAHRLTGIEFQNGGRANRDTNGIVRLDCTNTGTTTFRVDHNEFDHLNGVNLRPDTVVGVIDHNAFFTTSGRTAIYIHDDAWNGVGVRGDSSWFEDVIWGSSQFLFIEDNTLTEGSCTDGFRGTRAVFRFNTFTDCHVTVHGTESSARSRGSRAVEIYGNTFDNSSNEDVLANIRSGSALIWGNEASGLVGNQRTARLNQDRAVHSFNPFLGADGQNPWDVNAPEGVFGAHTATSGQGLTVRVDGADWTPSEWRGYTIRKTSACTDNCFAVILSNTEDVITFSDAATFGDGPLAFALDETFEITRVVQVLDGVGRAGGSLLSGGDNAHAPEMPAGWNDQVTFPLYEWLNTNDGEDIDFGLHASCVGTCRADEHFYDHHPVGFDGSTGVGAGPVADRPLTCTPGVAYWAADEGSWNGASADPDGRLYTCTAPDTWSLSYTPHTYPHPLVSGVDDPGVDECALGLDDCDVHATCTDLADGFACMCLPGWTGDGEVCVDVDECALDTDDCDAHATCTDIDGGFSCACLAGWTGDGEVCVDVDECALGADGCDAHAACTDVDGGFVCTCLPGWTGDGEVCVEVAGCTLGTDDCDVHAECTDLGDRTGCVCHPGWTGDGQVCVDVDECALGTDDCEVHALCADFDDRFDCTCAVGYSGDGHAGGTGCVDVDECALGLDDCSDDATCSNRDGGFDCACDDGLEGDGRVCVSRCGDRRIVAEERCDDGNTAPGDGCDGSCRIESGFVCTGEPSACSALADCGDGVVDAGEQCDDGDLGGGDGCSSGCVQEELYLCEGEPSVCAIDHDEDGVVDDGDNCPGLANPSQADGDGDGVGDACETHDMDHGAGCSSPGGRTRAGSPALLLLAALVCLRGRRRLGRAP